MALVVIASQGGPHWPTAGLGWLGLGLLTFLYGTAFTIMFIVLPRLGVAGNSAIMNAEPVFSLVLAWLILGQNLSMQQVLGCLIVVGSVMWLGLRKRR
jgi:drug/metabolite transporter (DMT)-like permease